MLACTCQHFMVPLVPSFTPTRSIRPRNPSQGRVGPFSRCEMSNPDLYEIPKGKHGSRLKEIVEECLALLEEHPMHKPPRLQKVRDLLGELLENARG